MGIKKLIGYMLKGLSSVPVEKTPSTPEPAPIREEDKVWVRVFTYPNLFANVYGPERMMSLDGWVQRWDRIIHVCDYPHHAFSGDVVPVSIFVCNETGEVRDQLDLVQKHIDKLNAEEDDIIKRKAIANAIWKDCRELYKEV